jgi:hypothetical protein
MRRKGASIGILLLSVGLGIALAAWMRRPVVLRLPSLLADRAVLGPLRDRSPEQAGEDFILSLQQGKCVSSDRASSQGVRLINTTCEKEARIPIKAWRLTDRLDEGNGTRLVYAWGNSQVPLSHGNPIEIEVEKRDGVWFVSTYDRVF